MDADEKHSKKVERIAERLRALSPGKQINDVARVFQQLVKLRHADKNGWCQCVTCEAVLQFNDRRLNAGHFVSRKHRTVVFDDKNCHPQCVKCNQHLNGNMDVYKTKMIKIYGKRQVDKLLAAKQDSRKWTVEELAELKIELMERVRWLTGILGSQ